jgi:hypothetical protein
VPVRERDLGLVACVPVPVSSIYARSVCTGTGTDSRLWTGTGAGLPHVVRYLSVVNVLRGTSIRNVPSRRGPMYLYLIFLQV